MKKFINKQVIVTFIISGILFSILTIYAETILPGVNISFNNNVSDLTSTNVQDAIDELNNKTNVGNADASNITSGKSALVQGKIINGTAKTYDEGFTDGKNSMTGKPYINIQGLVTCGNGSAGGITDMKLYTGGKCTTLYLGAISGGSNLYGGGAYIRALNSSGGVLTTFWSRSWSAAAGTTSLGSGGTYTLPDGTYYVQLYSYSNATNTYPANTITWSSIVIE